MGGDYISHNHVARGVAMLWLLAALLFVDPTPEKIMAQQRLKDGQALMSSEKFEQAAEAFREAIKLDPLLTMAHYGLGQAHMALKQYPSAVDAFRGAREAFHNVAAESMTQQLENEHARDKRIQALQDRIRENQDRNLSSTSTTAAVRLRDMRIQQWEVELATLQRSQLGGGHAIPKTPPGLSLALGSAYFRSGQIADAEREYRAALDVKPNLGEPRNNLAVVLLITGRPAEAKEQLAIAEKNGFKAPAGLKRDIDAALASASKRPEP